MSFYTIPLWMLGDSMDVCVPDGRGGFAAPVHVSGVCFQWEQGACDDSHRCADAGSGVVFVDALRSGGAFEVPVGSRVVIDGRSYYVRKVVRCCGAWSRVHHWEVEVS